MLDVFWRALGHRPNRLAKSTLFRSGVLSKPKNRDYTITWEGLTYTGSLRFLIDRHIYYAGGYSMHEIDFLRRSSDIIRQNKGSVLMLDIGANVGQHSLALHSHVDRIIAFEPNPAAAERLRVNISRNSIRNIELYEVALGDSDEMAVLGSGLEGNDGSRSLNWSINHSSDIIVQVKAAGSYITELIPGETAIDLLKIDVEGHEAKVLSSLSDRLVKDRPIIMFELVGKEVKGGFASEAGLRSILYPDHRLFGLESVRGTSLSLFDWLRHEEAICVPEELVPEIEDAFIRRGSASEL